MVLRLSLLNIAVLAALTVLVPGAAASTPGR